MWREKREPEEEEESPPLLHKEKSKARPQRDGFFWDWVNISLVQTLLLSLPRKKSLTDLNRLLKHTHTLAHIYTHIYTVVFIHIQVQCLLINFAETNFPGRSCMGRALSLSVPYLDESLTRFFLRKKQFEHIRTSAITFFPSFMYLSLLGEDIEDSSKKKPFAHLANPYLILKLSILKIFLNF